MSLYIPFFDDTKLMLLSDSSVNVGIGITGDIKINLPARKFYVITCMIFVSSLVDHTLQSLKIDGQTMTRTTTAVSTGQLQFFQSNMGIGTTASISFPSMLIPVRREIVMRITNNNAAANIFSWKIWGYVHDDEENEFKYESSVGLSTISQPFP